MVVSKLDELGIFSLSFFKIMEFYVINCIVVF